MGKGATRCSGPDHRPLAVQGRIVTSIQDATDLSVATPIFDAAPRAIADDPTPQTQGIDITTPRNGTPLISVEDSIEEYLFRRDWRVNANANPVSYTHLTLP